MNETEAVRRLCVAHGFSRVRVARAATGAPGIAAYDRFLAEGRHGTMAWMERSRPPRADPRQLLPSARTALVLGVDYAWPRPPDPGPRYGKVAAYAWGRDYHNLIGKRLRRLEGALREQFGAETYAGVDSRPLIERAWAEEAGLGFVGKNACVIVPGESSYLFLAVVLCDLDLEPDPPIATATKFCGRCRRCLDACPTDAFTAAGQLDARRCISYLTIEHRGPIPEELRPLLGRWVFGCDVCQEVCPHNHAPTASMERDLAPRPAHAWLDLAWILTTPDEELVANFAGSPLRRPGAVGLKRNAATVAGNSGDDALGPALEIAHRHHDPVVVDAAAWALARLGAR